MEPVPIPAAAGEGGLECQPAVDDLLEVPRRRHSPRRRPPPCMLLQRLLQPAIAAAPSRLHPGGEAARHRGHPIRLVRSPPGCPPPAAVPSLLAAAPFHSNLHHWRSSRVPPDELALEKGEWRRGRTHHCVLTRDAPLLPRLASRAGPTVTSTLRPSLLSSWPVQLCLRSSRRTDKQGERIGGIFSPRTRSRVCFSAPPARLCLFSAPAYNLHAAAGLERGRERRGGGGDWGRRED